MDLAHGVTILHGSEWQTYAGIVSAAVLLGASGFAILRKRKTSAEQRRRDSV